MNFMYTYTYIYAFTPPCNAESRISLILSWKGSKNAGKVASSFSVQSTIWYVPSTTTESLRSRCPRRGVATFDNAASVCPQCACVCFVSLFFVLPLLIFKCVYVCLVCVFSVVAADKFCLCLLSVFCIYILSLRGRGDTTFGVAASVDLKCTCVWVFSATHCNTALWRRPFRHCCLCWPPVCVCVFCKFFLLQSHGNATFDVAVRVCLVSQIWPFQICLFSNVSLFKCLFSNVSHVSLFKCVSFQMCLFSNVSLFKYVSFQMCLFSNVSLFKHVSFQMCLFSNMSLFKYVSFQICLFQNVSLSKHVSLQI